MNDIDSCQHELEYISTNYDVEIGEDQIYQCKKKCGYEAEVNIIDGEINVLVDYDIDNPIPVSSRPLNKEGKGIEPHIFDQIMDAQKERNNERYFRNKENYLYNELFNSENSDQATVVIKEIVSLELEIQKSILQTAFTELKDVKKSMDMSMKFLKKYNLEKELGKRMKYDSNKDRKQMK